MADTDRYCTINDKGDHEWILATHNPEAVSVELVSAIAGDSAMSQVEANRIDDIKASRGAAFFSDLLYAISHYYFSPHIAEGVWNEVLGHKFTMSQKLGRNVRITVATLDYLSNIKQEKTAFALMSETDLKKIVNLSMRDGMTGLFNHSTFYELLDLELRNQRRNGAAVALLLLDIDDFKAVNDSWGHQEGDRILIALAAMLNKETRDSDICCRFGGEEFAVILRYTRDPREALRVAERVRQGATRLISNGQAMAISAGLAMCERSSQTAHALVETADRALYEAKRRGKNQVLLSA